MAEKNRIMASTYLPIIVYLMFVWLMCLLRSNYMWIVGDDPNLLNQSILMSKGRTPNVDFFSGYPGLSQEVQELLIRVLDGKPYIQHVYTSILASLIGIYLYSKFRRVKSWVMFLFLFFGYTQAFLLNPTPNPGHLFQLFAVVVIFNLMSQDRSGVMRFAVIGICLALSVMSKQYGVALVLCVTEYLLILKLRLEFRKLGISILLLFNIFLSSIYYLSVRDGAISELEFSISTIIVILPALFLGWGLIRSDNRIVFKYRLSLLIPIFFTLTILTCYIWIYSLRNPWPILQELFIYAPREINKNVVAIELSMSSVSRASFGVFLLFLLSKADTFFSRKRVLKNQLFQLVLLIALLLCFYFIGNLSGTPFILFAFILLVFLSQKIDSQERVILRTMMFSIIPLFFILIPYPNYSYHIFIFIMFFAYILDNRNHAKKLKGESKHITLPMILTSLVLLVGYSVHENQWIGALPNYRFHGTLIESASDAWSYSIKTASKAESIECNDFGCWYLRLMTNPSASLMDTYRKPIWISKTNS